MSRIFISYRREDTGMGVGRLTDALREHFAREQIFQDISSIDPGADFIDALQQALADCAAVLVVIGPKWLSVADRQGRRRLDDPDDWVRQEIVEALGRPGLRVFPLLVDGAEMPAAGELPDAIKPLARRQAYELTLRHWAKDIAVLVETLRGIPALATAAPQLVASAAPAQRDGVSRQPEPTRPSLETGRGQNEGVARWGARNGLAVAGAMLAAGFGIWIAGSKVPEPVAVEASPKSSAPDPAPAKPDQPAQPPEAAQAVQPAPPAKPAAPPEAKFVSIEFDMVHIAAGCFEMGSPISEDDRSADERQHHVCVEPYAIGKTEVTQAQWQAAMGGNPSHFKCDGCPVENVSWIDAMAFIAKLNAASGKHFRLPTEAEWEYACRGGRPGERYCGGVQVNSVAWTDSNSGDRTHTVGQKQANGFGIYDMSGNVREWTCSGSDEDYRGGERQCANNASLYVTRGGSWYGAPRSARSADRNVHSPSDRGDLLGFRVARSLP